MALRTGIFFAALTVIVLPQGAGAGTLAPHEAVYDLKLSGDENGDIVDAEGRIALELRTDKCGRYDLDYRFVAKFQQDQETTLTDQQTVSTENQAGDEFHFTTKTFVDGAPEKEIRGEARHDGNATKVSMEKPQTKSFDLPLSRFPMAHTAELIAKAEAGERIVETKLFDGDDDAQKLLTSTAIIGPVTEPPKGAEASTAENVGPAQGMTPTGTAPAIRKVLDGLRSWRVIESYYNSDSDPDGKAVFETRYRLYENGVSDDLTLDFGDYAFTGSLSKLDLLDSKTCR